MSIKVPYSNSVEEYVEQMKHNRSSLYEFFKGLDFPMRFTNKGKGRYKVFQVPYKWENSYLMINDIRITDFQSVILYTNELVVRFSIYDEWQVNIPYKSIKKISVSNEEDIGYEELYLNK